MEKIVCFGEILWDSVPAGLFLGGAPFNAACHLRKLGFRPMVVSAVGEDFLGEEALERAKANGLDTFGITTHRSFRTGVAKVQLNADGSARYLFPEPCAWDRLELTDAARNELHQADAILFGSLATRSEPNEELLDNILSETRALRIFDVNLRPPYDDRLAILTLAQQADVLKLNSDELAYLSNLEFTPGNLEGALGAVASYTGVKRICVTLGPDGAAYFDGHKLITANSPQVEVRDTIGAGDAFTAAFVAGLARDDDMEDTLRHACQLGAYVASCDGAIPAYDPNQLFV